ncbi:MAG: DUF1566 domain-containing protein [Micavibrio aeruginosavorus]|nr:DUF1566 domain-containing protein [Micavibrio aeruginosavorus]
MRVINRIANVAKRSAVAGLEQKCLRSSRFLAALAVLPLCFASVDAYAACASPVGVEGEVIYNAAQNVPQICTGTVWVALGPLIPGASGTSCSNPAGPEGSVIYNAAVSKPQYCNGDNWIEMFGTYGSSGTPSCTGPSGCTTIGSTCADTTIFVGCHPITYNQMFVHPSNQGTTVSWSSESVVTSATDAYYGKTNQDWIVANKTITNYPAFKACNDLNLASALGYNDWYLPSRTEIYLIWLSGVTLSGNFYWSSTEETSTTAWRENSGNGGQSSVTKTTTASHDVRCMRRN